jgi:phospholipid/cholesterol/gamma-HCH transport system substrate-binding protein
METRANYVLIGLFTLAVIVGGFAFVWWFERASDNTSRVTYEIIYDGSVSGLRTGSAVLFNGIRVGEVTSLSLDNDHPNQVVTQIGVSAKTPIRADTVASLEYQGVTGIASVALDGGQQSSPPIAVEPNKLPRIPSRAGASADFYKSAQKIAGQVEDVTKRLDRLIADNEKKVNQVVDDVSTFTAVLNKRSGNIDTMLVDASELAHKLNGQADRLDGILKNVEKFTGGTGQNGFMTDLSEAAKSVRALSDNLNRSAPGTLKDYQALAVDARRAVAEIERVARNLNRDPKAFLFGSGGGSNIPSYGGR